MIHKLMPRAGLAVGLLMGLSACGQAPLDTLGDPAIIPTNLGLPVSIAGGFGFGAAGLQSRSSWQFAGAAQPVAPASGLVAEINGDSITILHSPRLATRFTGVTAPIVRAGDPVQTGSILSNVNFLGGTFTFSVLLDGQAVCPSSYLSSSVWQQIVGLSGFNAVSVCSVN
jgi:hypothetical protein